VTTIGINVNTRAVKTAVEPRTHLADFLRDQLNLTGTHLGCEHGVCGACTLLIDDMPARSCITLAAACQGAHITTIEGLDDDKIATELRAAFTREHALQCGYCTPGMLISARDLVLRLDTSDERAIRVGLSGNLCRAPVMSALFVPYARSSTRGASAVSSRSEGPDASGSGRSAPAMAHAQAVSKPDCRRQPSRIRSLGGTTTNSDFVPDKVFDERFNVASPPDKVFAMFGDIEQIATCLPGVSLTGNPTPQHVKGLIRVKLGPISASFRGAARIERDPNTLSGRIVGTGNDQRSRSSTQGEIRYRLVPIDGGKATRIELSIGYSLRGMLAQIAREALVRGLAARLTTEFARNLDLQLSGNIASAPRQAQSIDGAALIFDQLRMLVRKFFGRSQNG
jgi:Aerobic-type carbon monoxide dehydrogenase, small subunit CoxS/CutS homologs